MEEILQDKRFAHVAKDPRFRKVPVGERKVKIDKRFKGMFRDKRFKLKYSVDKRGRPMNVTTNENLKKFYELSDEGSSDEDQDFGTSATVVVDTDENDIRVDKKQALTKHKVTESSSNSGNSPYIKADEDANQGMTNKSKKSSEKDSRNVKSNKKKKRQKKNVQNYKEDISKEESNLMKQSNQKTTGKTNLSKYSDARFQMSDIDKWAEEPPVKKNNKEKNTLKLKQKGKSSSVEDRESSDSCESEDESNEELSSDDKEELSDSESSEEDVKQQRGNDSGVDFARGEGNMSSSSSDDDSDDDDVGSDRHSDKDDSDVDHRWGELDDNVEAVEDATPRLAVCNMDWDRMKAKDIYVLLNSFKPTDGIIKSVKVYPSEFGKERMAEEAMHGPRELKELKLDSDEEDVEEEDVEESEGTVYHREKLRQYQLKRLKYYYAVVECDTKATADHIYKECDGLEYESSATKLDLRFIPEEETFDDADISSECHGMPVNYKPQFFFNAALSQSKVTLTWDETDQERIQLTTEQFMKKGGGDTEEADLQAYLASSSDEEGPDYSAFFEKTEEGEMEEEDESDDERKLLKYKQLLTEIDKVEDKKKKKDVEMEISWEPGLKEATESLVKKKKQSKSKTVWDDYLERKKEKKKQKQEERKKKKERQQQENEDEEEEADRIPKEVESGQAFSDDEVPVDDDLAAFMAEEHAELRPKVKGQKKKKKRKKTNDVEREGDSREQAELSLLVMDEEEDKRHFNLQDLVQEKGKKKKKQKDQKQAEEDDFKVDPKDPRFTAIYDSHLFNVDPSAPEFRKTRGMEAIISEKVKRSGKRHKSNVSSEQETQSLKKQKLTETDSEKDSLESLIKSVKSKTKQLQNRMSKR